MPMFFMDAQNELRPADKAYLKALELYVWSAYRLDRPEADISTRAFLGPARHVVRASIRTNDEGILAGMQEAGWFLKRLGIKTIKTKKDGIRIKKGETILEIEGRAGVILGAERTLLNLLQRMSGVATKTKRLSVRTPKGVKLLATRKTLWGPLDKRAVAVGGGGTHRLHLADAILVKENHIALSPNIKRSLKRAFRHSRKARFVEIECENPQEVNRFLEFHAKLKKCLPEGGRMIVMLDNFTPRDVRKVIRQLTEAGVLVEISGGINERNIARYNIAGVSAVSSGSITTQAVSLDFSLAFNNPSAS